MFERLFGLKASDRGFFNQRHDFYLKQKNYETAAKVC